MQSGKRSLGAPFLLALLLCAAAFFAAGAPVAGRAGAAPAEEDYNTVRPGVYYVSPNGNDNNDGKTLDKAWKTLALAAYMMSSKGYDTVNTILVDDGVYYESSEVKPNGVVGKKEKPATIKAIHKWGAKIVSSSPYHGIYICNSQWFVLDGLMLDFAPQKVHNFGIAVFPDSDGKVSNHITIRNCIVTNAPSSGIQFNGTDNGILENNIVYKCALNEDGNNGSGISVYEPKECPEPMRGDNNEYGIVIRNNILWQNNCLHNCPGFNNPTDGNGIIIDDYRWTQNGNKYPYFRRTLVENNLVFDNGGRGVHVFISDNVTIRNNTVYQNGWNIMQYYPRGNGINMEQSSGNQVYNNLVVTLGRIASTAINDSSSDATAYRNNVVAGTVEIAGKNAFPEEGNSSGNRLLNEDEADRIGFYNPSVDLAFLNFSLQESGLAYNAGDTEAGYPADDITGAPRDVSDGLCVGAYEGGGQDMGIDPAFFDRYESGGGSIVAYTTPSNAAGKVGNVSDEYSAVRIAKAAAIGSLFVAREKLNCKSVSIYLKRVPGRFNVAVYSDNGGQFGLKLAETGTQSGATEEKRYTFDLDRTVAVEENGRVWIVLLLEGGADTEICAYSVPSAALIKFTAYTESAPQTLGKAMPSGMLLSANLNGASAAGATKKGCGCGSADASSAALLLLAAAAVLPAKKLFLK